MDYDLITSDERMGREPHREPAIQIATTLALIVIAGFSILVTVLALIAAHQPHI